MKILIVGAGIGGLSLAAFLKDSDVEFDIIEKSPTLDRQGFSIGLWNNGRNMLKKLGLSDNLDRFGTPIKTYRIVDGTGQILREYSLRSFSEEFGMGYTQVGRTHIHEWLLDIVGRDRIRLGKIFLVEDAKGYDLVVGADGIHSSVRSAFFSGAFETYDNWRIRYEWVERAEGDASMVTESIASGAFVGRFDSEGKTFIVKIAPRTHGIWTGELPGIASDMSHVKMYRIVTEKAALLGDAAHGFEPYAGLGASMAMEDAYVLAAELIKASNGVSSLLKALQIYQKTRKRRVKLAQKLTRRMRLWSTIKSPLLRRTINLLVPFIPERFFVNAYTELLREEI
jgi:2-polyprenyl-6-methoxyphenol hydroxylase-like FAD-dependent oxidoreductase